jgi:hypothetical protein
MLAYPKGADIAYTDSLPLMALFSKVLRPVLPAGWNPFGLWVLLCHLILAYAFCRILYDFGHRSLLSALAGSTFALLTPFFLFRLGRNHAALCGQFLVLFALLLYFQDSRAQRISWTWVGLLLTALLTHPYLFAMAAGIYLSSLVNILLGHSWSIRGVWRSLGCITVLIGLAILVCGYFSQPMLLTDPLGFGHFSMNLLSPFTRDYRDYDATGGQFDGFNYWGIGMFILLIAAAPRLYQAARRLDRSLLPLIAALFLFAALAVSNRVFWEHHLVVSYAVPASLEPLAEILRSSGRLFWPVSYAVMIAAMWGVLSLRPQRAIPVLLVAIAVQWVDTSPIRTQVKQLVAQAEAESLSAQEWRRIVQAHRLVRFLPPAQCHIEDGRLYAAISRVAANLGVPSTSVWASRYTARQLETCRTASRQLLEQGLEAGTLYVLNEDATRSIQSRPPLIRFCSRLDGYFICTRQRAELGLPALHDDWRPTLWSSQTTLSANQMADVLGIGWSYLENNAVWSVGYQSELVLRLPHCDFAEYLSMQIVPMTGQNGQTIRATANDGPPVTAHFQERAISQISIPLDACDPARPDMRVTLYVAHPVSAMELGESRDARPLGVALLDARLE